MKMRNPEIKAGDTVEVSIDVKNTGKRSGDKVVQLYIHQKAGSASRPVRELKGFERVALSPGETRTVNFKLSNKELEYWSASERKWVLETETFDVWVGSDSTAEMHSTFKIVK